MTDFQIFDSLWEQRDRYRLGSLMGAGIEDAQTLFLTSSTDLGVVRNGGRRGAELAPEGILNVLKKMIFLPHTGSIHVDEVGERLLETHCFEKAQEVSTEKMAQKLAQFTGSQIFHLGGGHDHIFPLLCALKSCPKLHIINIDAHLDTRTDSLPHSGTPFRQFDTLYSGHLKITQVGIHPFANIASGYSGLKGEMIVYSLEDVLKKRKQVSEAKDCWQELFSPGEEEVTVLSLDCDGLDSSCMEAVSAVNPRGFPLEIVSEIFEFYRMLPCSKKIYGVYEYNPVYDNLSQKGAKVLASLIFPCLSPH